MVGSYAGRVSNALEQEMAGADIVFGCARVALEAIAVGCAVVVCDAGLVAGMAKLDNFDSWRRENFGRRLVTKPVTEDVILEALADYDAQDATALSAKVREECNLDRATDRLEALYRDVILEQREGPPLDRAKEARAIANYLTQWLPSEFQKGPYGQAAENLWIEAQQLRAKLDGLTAELARKGLRVKFQNQPSGN